MGLGCTGFSSKTRMRGTSSSPVTFVGTIGLIASSSLASSGSFAALFSVVSTPFSLFAAPSAGVSWAVSLAASLSPSVPLFPLFPLFPLVSLSAFVTLGTIGTMGTFEALVAFGTLGTIGTFEAFEAVGTLGTLGTLGTFEALCTAGTADTAGTAGPADPEGAGPPCLGAFPEASGSAAVCLVPATPCG